MLRLARLSIRRPALALLGWATRAIALSVIGLGVTERLSPSITTVAGTSSRAQDLADSRFGPGVLVPILLEGPARRLDRQGPALVRALDRRVAFDLLTAAATFGVLTLLFTGDDPLLGGSGYIDPMSIIAISAFSFGVTMVYEVQLLQRTREEFLRTGDPHAALRTGLRRSAAGTGAALAMVAAVVPFAITGLVTVRMFAVGVAIAIVLDALIVRPVLLPAAVALLGRRCWWPTSHAGPRAEVPATPAAVAPALA